MKDRNQYNETEDFFKDESFQLWITQNIDEDNWKKWSYENIERAKLVQKARFVILSTNLSDESLNNKEKTKLKKKRYQKIIYKKKETAGSLIIPFLNWLCATSFISLKSNSNQIH
jgi:transmembrane sensor